MLASPGSSHVSATRSWAACPVRPVGWIGGSRDGDWSRAGEARAGEVSAAIASSVATRTARGTGRWCTTGRARRRAAIANGRISGFQPARTLSSAVLDRGRTLTCRPLSSTGWRLLAADLLAAELTKTGHAELGAYALDNYFRIDTLEQPQPAGAVEPEQPRHRSRRPGARVPSHSPGAPPSGAGLRYCWAVGLAAGRRARAADWRCIPRMSVPAYARTPPSPLRHLGVLCGGGGVRRRSRAVSPELDLRPPVRARDHDPLLISQHVRQLE